MSVFRYLYLKLFARKFSRVIRTHFRSFQITNIIKANAYCNFYSEVCCRDIFSVHHGTSRCFYSSAKDRNILNVTFDNSCLQKHLAFLSKTFMEVQEKLEDANISAKETDLREKMNFLQPLMALTSNREKLKQEIEELDMFISDLKKERDEELVIAAQEERRILLDHIKQYELEILHALVPEKTEDPKDIMMELSSGVGGQEAMLFTKNMCDMYCKYAAFKGWNVEVLRFDETNLGGVRNAHISINGVNAYKFLKLESGVHRVQRVPKTERAGRIHTSTMTVAVLPQPTEIDIVLEPKDIEMDFKRSSGAGGQHVNTTDSCVRLTHIPTGIVVECQVERCQHKNRELALKSLRAKLYQKKLEACEREAILSRKLQVGTAARSDKVRTYNFSQDRISDHRIHQNMYNIELFMSGGQQLDQLLQDLQDWSMNETLNEILKRYI